MAIPAIPTSFNVQQGDSQVYLTWDIIAGATSYSVSQSVDGVTYVVVGTPSINNYLDTAVTVNTQYWYRVASVNGSGTSPYCTAQTIIPTRNGVICLGELRLRSQQAADMVSSQFLTMPEWNFNINQSARELYDLLITVYEDYFISPRVMFTTDGSYQYDLPNGDNYSGAEPFYKMYGVDCGLDSSTNAWVTLRKFDFISRNQYVYPQITSTFLGVFNLQYRVLGDKIMFIPTPAANQVIGLWYFPRLPTLLQDTDVFDTISGWSEYIIVDAAIKALRKEESDTSVLMAQKQALLERIQTTASNRDAGQPDTISNTRMNNWNWSGGPDYGSSGGC